MGQPPFAQANGLGEIGQPTGRAEGLRLGNPMSRTVGPQSAVFVRFPGPLAQAKEGSPYGRRESGAVS